MPKLSRARAEGDRAENPFSSNSLPRGATWFEINQLCLEIHDLTIGAMPLLRDLKGHALNISARLSVAWYKIIMNADEDGRERFLAELDRKFRGNDRVVKFVKFVIFDAVKGDGSAFKGIQDLIVAGIHVAHRENCRLEAPFPTIPLMETYLGSRSANAGRRSGLDACWTIYMDLRRAEAESRRLIALEAERVAASVRDAIRASEEADEARELGISVDELRQRKAEKRTIDQDHDENTRRWALMNKLIGNGRPVSMGDRLEFGTLVIAAGPGKLVALNKEDALSLVSFAVESLRT